MKKIFLIAFIIYSCSCFAQTRKTSSSLLWRITGNGLQKPSYLYGTMHLTDERVFNIGDSLYKAIENSEGFAIEINPEGITELVIDEAKAEILNARKIKDMFDEKQFKKYSKALAKKLDKDENEITTADVLKEKNKWVEESYRTGKMTTFLDAYLFDIARRQGKWTGGVEDVDDQRGLLDDYIDETDLEEITMDEDVKMKGGKKALDEMIRYYTAGDLDAIENFSAYEDSLYRDALLTKRNIKMAMRMDSLSQERSMVFAVGAAHLPGDDGVIALLRQRGFTVTPVFSSKKIKPADYKVAEVPLPWYDVNDENGFYKASMPGKPGNLAMYGIMNMKMYFDIFSSTLYMTMALNSPYTQAMADSVFSEMTEYYFGIDDYKKGKPVTIDGVQGREFAGKKDDAYTRAYMLFKNGMMYLALGMSMKKDAAAERSIDKFLHSFTITQTDKSNTAFIPFIDTVKAYAIDLPSAPQPAGDFLADASDKSVKRIINIASDPATGAYLFFGLNEAAKGYHFDDDKAIFENVKRAQKEKFSSIIIDTFYEKNNHRTFDFGGIMSTAPLMMKCRYIFRSNRWYALAALYDPQKESPSVERFFSSFRMLEYPASQWQQYVSADGIFSVWAPSFPDYTEVPSLYSSDTTYQYNSYDSVRADNFFVVPESFGRYYWQNSDSAFWSGLAAANEYSKDTILSKIPVTNGDTKGWEVIKQNKGSGIVSRFRMLLYGDTIYTLSTFQPASEIYNNNNNKFFEGFRFTKPAPLTHIFTSKANLLLNDLSSSDSATFDEAKQMLRSAPFTDADVPAMLRCLMKNFPADTGSYESAKKIIGNKLLHLNHDTAFQFAKNNYLQADDDLKNILLSIMTAVLSKENLETAVNLLVQKPPQKKLPYDFISNITDSAELGAAIIPQLLPLLKDTVLAPGIIRMAATLLDSNHFSTSLLLPYKTEILFLAQKRYKALSIDADDYDFSNYSLTDVLGKLNLPETNAMLQKFLQVKEYNLQLHVLEKLLKNSQPINPQILQSLAADKESRADLYNKLKDAKRKELFPKQYSTQKYFAESLVWSAAYDEEEPSGITYLTQKTISFAGKASKFFFYKITYTYDEEEYNRLACAGPFSTNESEFISDDTVADLYYDEDFDSENLQEQMDFLVEQTEEWFKERKEEKK